MLSDFNLPSVDHLIEGYHYTEVSYDFANRCPKGTWADQQNNGICTNKDILLNRRKLRNQKRSQQPMRTPRKKNPTVQGSNFENNKKITTGDGDFGWAKKDGKPVLVKWGSVAGILKNDNSVSHNVSVQQG
jgi:hypothetical protein